MKYSRLLMLTFGLASGQMAAAAAPTLSYFCQSSVAGSQTFYVTAIFAAAAPTSDVAKAWRAHIADTDPKARQKALCQGGLDVQSLEELRTLTMDSMKREHSIVDVPWSYSAGR